MLIQVFLETPKVAMGEVSDQEETHTRATLGPPAVAPYSTAQEV